jgi:two-component SAPR family response regulator
MMRQVTSRKPTTNKKKSAKKGRPKSTKKPIVTTEQDAERKKVKVLLVDDDKRIRESVSRALTLSNYHVLTAKCGQDTISLFEKERPQIILLDIRLPDIDGFEVLKEIHARDETVEVLFITGHGDMSLVISAMRAGASDFIPKPLQLEHIIESISLAEKRLQKKAQNASGLSIRTKPTKKVEVRAFGNLWMRCGEKVIVQHGWLSPKTRDVFKLLLINHRKLARTEEFYEVLWADTRRESAEIGLYTAISYIRRIFEPELSSAKDSRYVLNHSGGYELHLGATEHDYDYDVERFRNLCAQSRNSGGLESLRTAVELYTDDFLKDDVTLTPVIEERERLRDIYLNALVTLGRNDLAAGRLDEALYYSQKITKADLLYEAGYEIQIQAYLKQGYVAKARRVLENCREIYLEELGVPEPQRLAALLPQSI